MSIFKIGLILAFVSLAQADTVTTKDSRTWNGKVTKIQGGVLTLSAQFSGQTKLLNFGADSLRSIQFNTATYNPGAVPATPAPRSSSLRGTIYRGKKAGTSQGPLSCDDITAAAGPLSCVSNGKAEIVTRPDVVQILVGQ
ncbi:MAG TPA: hypothetical protein VGG72_10245 [Bryobacteraceae bacterium]|jgi:hypothetical protein